MVKEIGLLREQPLTVEVDEGMPESKAHVAMLHEVSKVFETRDIVVGTPLSTSFIPYLSLIMA